MINNVAGWPKHGKRAASNLANDNYMAGVPNINQNTAGTAEVLSTGFGHIWVLVPPRCFDPEPQQVFARLVNRGQKGVSGISDYELQKGSYTAGNNAEEIPIFTGGIKKNNNTFTIKFQETADGLVRAFQHYWATAMADLESGYTLYHGKIASGELELSAFNHTATFLYCMTDNSGGAGGMNSILFACSWTWAFPDVVKNDHYNWTPGEHNAVEIDWAFNGVFHETPSDYQMASVMLKAQGMYLDNAEAFDPGSVVKDAVNAFANSGGEASASSNGTFNLAEHAGFQQNADSTNASVDSGTGDLDRTNVGSSDPSTDVVGPEPIEPVVGGTTNSNPEPV